MNESSVRLGLIMKKELQLYPLDLARYSELMYILAVTLSANDLDVCFSNQT